MLPVNRSVTDRLRFVRGSEQAEKESIISSHPNNRYVMLRAQGAFSPMAPAAQDQSTIRENEKLKQQVCYDEALGEHPNFLFSQHAPLSPSAPPCLLPTSPCNPVLCCIDPSDRPCSFQVAFLDDEVSKYIKFLQVRH